MKGLHRWVQVWSVSQDQKTWTTGVVAITFASHDALVFAKGRRFEPGVVQLFTAWCRGTTYGNPTFSFASLLPRVLNCYLLLLLLWADCPESQRRFTFAVKVWTLGPQSTLQFQDFNQLWTRGDWWNPRGWNLCNSGHEGTILFPFLILATLACGLVQS